MRLAVPGQQSACRPDGVVKLRRRCLCFCFFDLVAFPPYAVLYFILFYYDLFHFILFHFLSLLLLIFRPPFCCASDLSGRQTANRHLMKTPAPASVGGCHGNLGGRNRCRSSPLSAARDSHPTYNIHAYPLRTYATPYQCPSLDGARPPANMSQTAQSMEGEQSRTPTGRPLSAPRCPTAAGQIDTSYLACTEAGWLPGALPRRCRRAGDSPPSCVLSEMRPAASLQPCVHACPAEHLARQPALSQAGATLLFYFILRSLSAYSCFLLVARHAPAPSTNTIPLSSRPGHLTRAWRRKRGRRAPTLPLYQPGQLG